MFAEYLCFVGVRAAILSAGEATNMQWNSVCARINCARFHSVEGIALVFWLIDFVAMDGERTFAAPFANGENSL